MHRLTTTTARVGAAAATAALLAACAGPSPATPPVPPPAPTAPLSAPARVISVADGDTIRIAPADGTPAITVRLLGIDAPETVDPRKPIQCYGPQASAHLKQTLAARTVQLEYGAEPTDRYGRTLAYIWLDGQLLNYQLAADGYAREYTYNPRQPGAHATAITAAEQQARAAGRGLWNPTGCNGRT